MKNDEKDQPKSQQQPTPQQPNSQDTDSENAEELRKVIYPEVLNL